MAPTMRPYLGPSPRVWGAELQHLAVFPGGRTIPAGAGSSSRPTANSRTSWDHPRRHGEQQSQRRCRWKPLGPSPRVQGASRGLFSPHGEHRDHPCRYGEQTWPSKYSSGVSGPSPRVRGAEHLVPGAHEERGTIPAGTESRAPGALRLAWSGDRLRGCGEQLTLTFPPAQILGPSHRGTGCSRTVGRIRTVLWDYRGQSCPLTMHSAPWGPSPRVRGQVVPPTLPDESRGLSPRCGEQESRRRG